MSTANYFSFQGKLYLGNRLANGKPGKTQWVNDAATAEITLTTEKDEKTESWSGQRMTAATLQKSKKGSLKLSFETLEPDMLALGLYSKVIKTIAGTVTGEELPPELTAGDIVMLEHGTVTDLVLTDSTAPAPKTVELDEGYREENFSAGLITIGDLDDLEQPLKAAYSYGASVDLAMNTVDGSRAIIDLYRVKFNPFDALGLIHESWGNLPITADVLFDATNALDANLGGFGRWRMPEVA